MEGNIGFKKSSEERRATNPDSCRCPTRAPGISHSPNTYATRRSVPRRPLHSRTRRYTTTPQITSNSRWAPRASTESSSRLQHSLPRHSGATHTALWTRRGTPLSCQVSLPRVHRVYPSRHTVLQLSTIPVFTSSTQGSRYIDSLYSLCSYTQRSCHTTSPTTSFSAELDPSITGTFSVYSWIYEFCVAEASPLRPNRRVYSVEPIVVMHSILRSVQNLTWNDRKETLKTGYNNNTTQGWTVSL